ncbi:hypothetical protein [Clostridium sp. ZBS13]|uniref:hypothetical protein n=1 Tax=Clostridium sp. ZBS13 TaxID=2949971 RepID=UPI00207A5B0E|nr:hypothetical protein [Clostridium sp. ZBS13]
MKKIIPALLLSVSLFSCVAANASVRSETLKGRSAESSYFYLGEGKFTLTAECTEGSGKGRVMKIIPKAPDKAVATVNVTKPYSGTKDFDSVATNGDDQSYYLRWNGAKATSEADLSIDYR